VVFDRFRGRLATIQQSNARTSLQLVYHRSGDDQQRNSELLAAHLRHALTANSEVQPTKFHRVVLWFGFDGIDVSTRELELSILLEAMHLFVIFYSAVRVYT